MGRELFYDPEKPRNYALRAYMDLEYEADYLRGRKGDDCLYNDDLERTERATTVCLVAVYREMIMRAYEENEYDCKRGAAIMQHGIADLTPVCAAQVDWYYFAKNRACEAYETYMNDHLSRLYLTLEEFENILGEKAVALLNPCREWTEYGSHFNIYDKKSLRDEVHYEYSVAYKPNGLFSDDVELEHGLVVIKQNAIGREYLVKKVFGRAAVLFGEKGIPAKAQDFTRRWRAKCDYGVYFSNYKDEADKLCSMYVHFWQSGAASEVSRDCNGPESNPVGLSCWFGRKED